MQWQGSAYFDHHVVSAILSSAPPINLGGLQGGCLLCLSIETLTMAQSPQPAVKHNRMKCRSISNNLLGNFHAMVFWDAASVSCYSGCDCRLGHPRIMSQSNVKNWHRGISRQSIPLEHWEMIWFLHLIWNLILIMRSGNSFASNAMVQLNTSSVDLAWMSCSTLKGSI